ncbi:hypothetical protein TOPH_03095 [Tolypocladium ophioglossoides CBS 100239]|uniref:Uncharacterized protein n=1 Tax=Tolypocladium ophioglossoides (strain CBS 100239) TaxID=1163406 RepID=A0A0L0NEJ6_TOLOC|nr:hypothetical protein TOPH_03095 [Tolypocladium ophioglossoides CBS 100239]
MCRPCPLLLPDPSSEFASPFAAASSTKQPTVAASHHNQSTKETHASRQTVKMPQNKGLGGKYPSTFCEWVVGQSIENALGMRPRKLHKQRGIVKVEVTTDDETEEDSLKVTYPRSGHSASSPKATGSIVKKVRFVDTPKKSAMKKAAAASSESEGEASESAPSSKSDKETTEAESSDAPSRKSSKSKKSKKSSASSDSEADSEPHPTCKCARCARSRGKSKKRAKADEESDSEAPASEADSTPKAKNQDSGKSKKKGGKKGNEKKDESEADDEASESAKATEDEAETISKKKGAEKNKQESNKQKGKDKQQSKGDANQKGGNKQGKANKEETTEPQKEPVNTSEKAADGTKKKSKYRTGNKKGDYPEAFLAPHPRRPNLIEPIRAEVVQTERVVESPEDPPPNAYYDPEHGVLRVYHGPVYGSSQGHALYPRRDASGRPLPVGMPHPTQNPYYYGFKQVPPQQGQEHVPITQGMPLASYNAMCPPPAFVPGFPGDFPQGGPPGMWQDPNAQPNPNVNPNPVPNPNGNKGAFSMSGANGGSPFSKHKDKDGANNVAPGSVKHLQNNPYYKPRVVSQFSTYGSRVPSHASQRSGANNAPGSNLANTGFPSNDGAGDTGQPANGAWGSTAQDNGAWSNADQAQGNWGANGTQELPSQWENQTGHDEPPPGNVASSQAAGWNNTNGGNGNDNGSNGAWGNGDGNGSPANNNGNWNNQAAQPTDEGANGATSQWGNTTEADNHPLVVEASNVMPGSWDAFPTVPSWGDTTMAANSGGLVDREAW